MPMKSSSWMSAMSFSLPARAQLARTASRAERRSVKRDVPASGVLLLRDRSGDPPPAWLLDSEDAEREQQNDGDRERHNERSEAAEPVGEEEKHGRSREKAGPLGPRLRAACA